MAPEYPPRLLVFDLALEGERLVGMVESVEVRDEKRPLRVRWGDAEISPGYFSVGQGVAFVEQTDGVMVVPSRVQMPALGGREWAWDQGLPPGYRWLMLVMVLPQGSTIGRASHPPVAAKLHGTRVALYWVLAGDDLGRTQITWSLTPLTRDILEEIESLNRRCVAVRERDAGVDLQSSEKRRQGIERASATEIRGGLHPATRDRERDSSVTDGTVDGLRPYERLLAFVAGAAFLGLLAYAGLRDQPLTNDAQIFFLRVVASIAAAAFGGFVSGFLRVHLRRGKLLVVRAGGALAIFVIVFSINPPRLVPAESAKPREVAVVKPQPVPKPWLPPEHRSGPCEPINTGGKWYMRCVCDGSDSYDPLSISPDGSDGSSFRAAVIDYFKRKPRPCG